MIFISVGTLFEIFTHCNKEMTILRAKGLPVCKAGQYLFKNILRRVIFGRGHQNLYTRINLFAKNRPIFGIKPKIKKRPISNQFQSKKMQQKSKQISRLILVAPYPQIQFSFIQIYTAPKINQKHIIFSNTFSNMQEAINAVSMSAIITIANPLELIKSRYQTMNEMIAKGALNHRYKGIRDCAKNITTQEGVRALWKGNSISIIRFFPNENINFEVKNLVKSFLPNSMAFNIIAGVCGGLVAAAILYPIDTARLYISTSKQRAATSVREITNNIKFEGIRYLYRGFSSCLLGISIFRGSFFGLYDTFKSSATNNFQKWLIAYASGLFAGILVYPIQTLRKRNIISKQKIEEWKLFRQIVSREGFRVLFRGCTMTPVQSFAGSAVLLYFDTSDEQI